MKSLIILFGMLAGIACTNGNGNRAASTNKATDSHAIEDSQADSSLADTATLAGKWYLIPVLPSDTVTGKLANISFMTGTHQFAGSTGCNRMSGTFTQAGHNLQFGKDIITTKMACVGYNEKGFLESLQHVNNYRFENGILILRDDEAELSRWSRQPVKLPKTKEV